MPWGPEDAERHTGKADTPKLRALWADVANNALARGSDDASAIRQANAVVEREKNKRESRRI